MYHSNKRRAVKALTALRGGVKKHESGLYYNHSIRKLDIDCPVEGIADLLADLRHLCDALGLDFAELDSRAYDHYICELLG